ncbi:ribonuclease H2, subunit C [Astrocystis sublimbata]|nr:ribonuclease H2, subunit C [Astrocystis sublimbata]
MSPPLFTVETGVTKQESAAVNLLPCRVHHDGDVNPSGAFWNPSKSEGEPFALPNARWDSLTKPPGLDTSHTAYFRGRKLQGKAVKLPDGYYGAVLEKTDAKPEARPETTDEDIEVMEDPEDQLDVGAMKGKAAFDELMIWGHESTSDSTADPYVRGMEEWIAFAEEVWPGTRLRARDFYADISQIHSADTESKSTT